jgi:isoquinoline 1-oxidoreductase beta subunit
MNPNSVEAQMQGGIIHGLSAMLWGQVTFKSGVASARNFNNYPPVRMKDAPLITVQILNSGAAPSGTGEPGVPPIGPAVAAAYFRLTGKRVRALPFFPGTTISG